MIDKQDKNRSVKKRIAKNQNTFIGSSSPPTSIKVLSNDGNDQHAAFSLVNNNFKAPTKSDIPEKIIAVSERSDDSESSKGEDESSEDEFVESQGKSSGQSKDNFHNDMEDQSKYNMSP